MDTTGRITKEERLKPITESSEFQVMFPQYRLDYIKETESNMKKILASHQIELTVDYKEKILSVKNSKDTRDPFSIVQARDFIRLVARSVPYTQAIKVFQDDVSTIIITLSRACAKRETYLKRRERLYGPNGVTLRALELLTGCYIVLQGNTLCAMGPPKGLKQVEKTSMSCMNNKHPVYLLKELMVRKELESRKDLENADWSIYLPQFKKKHDINAKQKSKAAKVARERKANTELFPQQPVKRKVDIQLLTGEYDLNKDITKKKKRLRSRIETKTK